jgi:hypothetical protein
MCHQTLVGVTTLQPQPVHICGTPGGVSDCSGERSHGATEEVNPVLVVIHQGVARFAHQGRPSYAAARFNGGEKASAPHSPGGILVQKMGPAT